MRKLSKITLFIVCIVVTMQPVVAQNTKGNDTTALKNHFMCSASLVNYKSTPLYDANSYDDINASNFSSDLNINYRIEIKNGYSFLTGIEFTNRYSLNVDTSLKLKLSESFIQIPLAISFGPKTYIPNQTVELDADIGIYLSSLLSQQVLHAKNVTLPADIKDKYSAFSYYKWGYFIQLRCVMYTKDGHFGVVSGIKAFEEPKNSSFGKSSDIKFTPAYYGVSYVFGFVAPF